MATEGTSAAKGHRQRQENQRIYGQALPRAPPDGWLSRVFKALAPASFSSANDWDEPVVGVLDEASRSVWIFDEEHQMTLWRKGFFGKGNLSRSEPTWLRREINRLQVEKRGGKELTAEEVTAKRRLIRQQFKQQRAEAMAAAEAEAEISFATNPDAAPVITTVIPSTQTAGLNRQLHTILSATNEEPLPELTVEEMPDNMEHLQLSLQEAFFLSWAVGCLSVKEQDSGETVGLSELWIKCQRICSPLTQPQIDGSFLVNYVAYHYFRSLGWVVKSGLKFCVDYLLYKKGPVFHHAEFAVVIIPSYVEPSDQDVTGSKLANTGPMSWQWFSTINRSNAQVMKTLILAYVIIPPKSSVSLKNLSSPEAISLFSVRTVVIKRFVAARMRD